MTLLWQAPPALDADSVVFRVTVVQEHDIYWVARDSAPLRVVRAAELPPQAALPGPEPTSQDSAPVSMDLWFCSIRSYQAVISL